MRKPIVLITGAAGEIGHALIRRLTEGGQASVLTLDLKPLDAELAPLVTRAVEGSILEQGLLEQLGAEYEVDAIYHLAALLSTRAEFTPVTAHQVNVDGTLKLLEFAHSQAASHGRPVSFLFPSSIAVYGLPDLDTKARCGRIAETEWTEPITMYGCNKLYCEQLGRYYASHYKQLDKHRPASGVDFRSIRYPGLISADTLPTGGTSDFAPEMIHAAAQGKPYDCFVRADARIPFMAMPDAVEALLKLAAAPAERLSRRVYNVTSFNPSAGEIEQIVRESFPRAEVDYVVDAPRQAIVDSWPADVSDDAARRDWGYKPDYDLRQTFEDYLIPRIRERYRG